MENLVQICGTDGSLPARSRFAANRRGELTWVCGLLLFIAHGAGSRAAESAFAGFVEASAREWVQGNPQQATATLYFAGSLQSELDGRLLATDALGVPIDPGERERRLGQAEVLLRRLGEFDRDKLTSVERRSAEVMEFHLQRMLELGRCAEQRYVFEPIRGLHFSLVNFLAQVHPVRNEQDARNYLHRLAAVAPLLEAGRTECVRRERRGIVPPRALLAAVIEQLDRLAAPAEKHVLVASFASRLAAVPAISSGQQAELRAQAERIVGDEIVPAIRHVRATLAEQLPTAPEVAPSGPEAETAYRAALRFYTTTTLSAEEIHAIGVEACARLEADLSRVLGELGLVSGSVDERVAKLNASVRPAADPDPRPRQIDEFRVCVRDAERRAQLLFSLRPQSRIEVRQDRSAGAASAAAQYTVGAADGSRPGILWIPLPDRVTERIWTGVTMRSATYHEAIPGHHFQLSLQQELDEIPRFRRFAVFGSSAAFAEGWAMYAERLAAEAGWYQDDPQGRAGQIYLELIRARRLVVDTGLNAKSWTRAEAGRWRLDASELDRYLAQPGQACAYFIGQREILAQRARVREALQARFSLPEFHALLLRTGNVPLSVLRGVIDDYLQQILHP